MKLPNHEVTDYDVGNGYTVTVECPADDYNEAPWEHEDGHGPVSDWERRDKRPGERVLATDRNAHLFYDYQEAIAKAKREGWDAQPYGTGTKAEQAARAVEHDFNLLRQWCSGKWCYIGVNVTVKRNGEEVGNDSLWGIESYGDYWRQVAEELATAIITAAERETTERAYWASRDVATA